MVTQRLRTGETRGLEGLEITGCEKMCLLLRVASCRGERHGTRRSRHCHSALLMVMKRKRQAKGKVLSGPTCTPRHLGRTAISLWQSPGPLSTYLLLACWGNLGKTQGRRLRPQQTPSHSMRLRPLSNCSTGGLADSALTRFSLREIFLREARAEPMR